MRTLRAILGVQVPELVEQPMNMKEAGQEVAMEVAVGVESQDISLPSPMTPSTCQQIMVVEAVTLILEAEEEEEVGCHSSCRLCFCSCGAHT